MKIKNFEQILKRLSEEDFIEELKNNKSNSRGKLLNLFNSNWRNKISFINKFKIIAEASRNINYNWKQKGGQNTFKEGKTLFAKKMGLFSVDKNNVFTLTEKGELWLGAIEDGKSNDFVNECLQYFDIKNELNYLKGSLNNILKDENIFSLIRSIKNKPHSELLKEYTIISIIKIPNFVEYLSEFPKDILKLSKVLDELNIFLKYKNSQVSKKTLLDSLDIINSYEQTTYNDGDSNRYTNVIVKKIKRDKNEVLKVLNRSRGICEICENTRRQFRQKNGKLYSHAHHLMPLGKLENSDLIEKYDKAKYMINLCPFHHASIHNNLDRNVFLEAIKKAKKWGMLDKLEDLEK